MPQVRVQREVLEADEEVLAVRADVGDLAAGEPLGPAVGAKRRCGGDLLGDAPEQDRADPVRARSGGVALRH